MAIRDINFCASLGKPLNNTLQICAGKALIHYLLKHLYFILLNIYINQSGNTLVSNGIVKDTCQGDSGGLVSC